MVSFPFVIFMILAASIFDRGEDFATHSGQIIVTNTHLSFGETRNSPTVAVLGEIKNTSPISWKDINLHAQFTDPSGRLIDVATEDKYSFHLPAHATSSFKLSFRREFPKTNFHHHTIHILSAQDSRTRW